MGTHLFSRITADNGQDSRFENIRTSPPKFFGAFMAQATWVSLCLLPVMERDSRHIRSNFGIECRTESIGMVWVAIGSIGWLFLSRRESDVYHPVVDQGMFAILNDLDMQIRN